MTKLFSNYFRHLVTLRAQEATSDGLGQAHELNQMPPRLAATKPVHPCTKCERTFNSKYNVVRHLKQFHAESRMYKCDVCDKDYKWIDSLHKHRKTHVRPVQATGLS